MKEKQRLKSFDDARAAAEEKMLAAEEEQEVQEEHGLAQDYRGDEEAALGESAEQEEQGLPQNEENPNVEEQQEAIAETDSRANSGAEQPDPRAMQMMAMQNQQMQAQMQQLQMQNQQLQQLLQEMSSKKEADVTDDALTPPVLDIAQLWNEDENVVAQKQQEYAQQVADYAKKQLMNELSPLLETARQSMVEKERQEALNGLSQVPELAGIMGMTPTLERIIQSNPALRDSSASIEDKLITAYAIAKGAEAIKKGEEPTKTPGVEDFMQMYAQDPELQKRVELARARNAASAAQDAPPMSASAGAASAALNVQEKPKDFEEARKLAFARLGV